MDKQNANVTPDPSVGLIVPTAYIAGYEKARPINQAVADSYIRHTTIGDPELDSLMMELSDLPPPVLHRYVSAGIEMNDGELAKAPEAMRKFFDSLEEPPWVNHEAYLPGMRAFHKNAGDTIIAFLCGVLVEGFTTLIRKSFIMTGRVIHEPTQRRQKQNIRQLLEIFLPNGLQRYGDGWKLCARVRFVHARIRKLISEYPDWDHEAWGAPLSAANLGYSISLFSAGLMEYSARMGAVYTEEEKESVMAVWRLAGHVMGIPETILYTTTEEALTIRCIGRLCEPPCDKDSTTMSYAWLSSAPATAGVSDPKAAQKLKKTIFLVSRSLIGDDLADQMQFPKPGLMIINTLFVHRLQQRIERMLRFRRQSKFAVFGQFIEASAYENSGKLLYNMPDHVKHKLSQPW